LTSSYLTVIFALAAAAAWGAGDFNGGIASKRSNVYGVVLISQFIGVGLLLLLLPFFGEHPPAGSDLWLAILAGVSGALGLISFYRALAESRMGMAAPVTAMITTCVPVLFGIFFQGLPDSRQLAGIAIALPAIWLVTQADGQGGFRWSGLRSPIIAGAWFGLFFILIDRVSEDTILAPLVAVQIASVGLLLAISAVRRSFQVPAAGQLPFVLLAGFFDTGGNLFFALANRYGRLDIASVLGSLYPAVTVLLAWLFLKECLSLRQWIGVAVALIAITLITI
jgi:drug/metabolite transporter (DMT)-like permease